MGKRQFSYLRDCRAYSHEIGKNTIVEHDWFIKNCENIQFFTSFISEILEIILFIDGTILYFYI